MGYHINKINTVGVFGKLSKIKEELEELEDAESQDNKILMMVELSDLFGAIEGYANNLGLTISDLQKMSDATKRAFLDGTRKNKS
jgi:hypothetical protein